MITPQSELSCLHMHDLLCICPVTLLLQSDTIISGLRFVQLLVASSASKKCECRIMS